MRIAVVEHADTGYFSEYISTLIDAAAENAGYEIKTYRDSVPVANQYIGENAVIYIVVETQNAVMLKWWYNIKLRSIFKKIKADVVVGLNSIASNTKLLQLLVFDQSFFLEPKALNNINKFAVKNLAASINSVKNIIVCSKHNAEELRSKQINNQNIELVYFTAPAIFKKYEWHEKIMIKAMQAENNDYFLSVINDDAEDDFMLMLRAFSKFKKWQQSNMKLIVLPKYEGFSNSILTKLSTYKYREDVKLPQDLDETSLVSVFASAHSLLHITASVPDLMIISIALQCAVPVISFKNKEVEEYAGEAALYIEENTFESTGDAIIKLYKDENLHAQLKQEAEKRLLLLKREDYQNKLWQTITGAVKD